MKLPERFTKYPLISLAVVVGLLLLMAYVAVDLFGTEWVASMIEGRIDKMEGTNE